MDKRKRRELWITRLALLVIFFVLAFVMVATKKESVDNSRKVATICRLFAAIGNSVIPPTATSFGVNLIVEARNGSIVLGCRELLDPPSDTLQKLVKKYHKNLKG